MKLITLAVIPLLLAPMLFPTQINAAEVHYGPTKDNDNLWDISSRYQQSKGSRIVKWIFAIYKANPTAFKGDNLHQLKLGSKLTIPRLEKIRETDYDKALKTLILHKAMLQKGIAVDSNQTVQQPSIHQTQTKALRNKLEVALTAQDEAKKRTLALSEQEMALQARIIELKAQLEESSNRIQELEERRKQNEAIPILEGVRKERTETAPHN